MDSGAVEVEFAGSFKTVADEGRVESPAPEEFCVDGTLALFLELEPPGGSMQVNIVHGFGSSVDGPAGHRLLVPDVDVVDFTSEAVIRSIQPGKLFGAELCTELHAL